MMGSHGFRPYMKQQPYSESANIPFLISYPGINRNQGKTANAAITTPDILPSLLSLSNISIPKSIEGYDLSGIMKKPKIHPDRAALYMNICRSMLPILMRNTVQFEHQNILSSKH